MITHIVTLVSQRKLAHRDVLDENNGRDIVFQTHMRSPFEPVANFQHKDFLDLGTFFFEDEKNARLFAQYAAAHRPGFDVYVSETKTIVTVEIGDPVFKKVTTKGVIPE